MSASVNNSASALFSTSLLSSSTTSGSKTADDIKKAAAGVGSIKTPTLPTLAQLLGQSKPSSDALPISDTSSANDAGAAAVFAKQARTGFAANLLSSKSTRRTGTISRPALKGV